jgi:hypothetical protein
MPEFQSSRYLPVAAMKGDDVSTVLILLTANAT